MSTFGERVELTRYRLPGGERVLYGQRIDGAVAVADVPASDHGRVYLVERRVESKADLNGLIAAYVADSRRRGQPAARRPTADTRAGPPELASAAPPGGVTRTGALASATPGSDPTSTHHRQGDGSR